MATRNDRPAQVDATQALVAVTREIDNRMAIVHASAAAGIDAERLKLVALTVFTRTPQLLTCEPVSIARAIVEAGQLGLEPTGLLGGAYLVPRGGKATLLVGYKGLVMLAKRSGEVQRVEARVVRKNDEFRYGYGLEPYLEHVPAPMGTDPGDYVAAYAVLVYRDGARHFDVMSHAELEAVRRRSTSPDAGPWVTDWPEMAKKTVLRRLMKLAPLTIDVAAKLDELDPEVADVSPRRGGDGRQDELRRELQAALEREGSTTQAAAVEEPSGQARAQEEGAAAASSSGPEAQQEAAAGPVPAAAPAAEAPVEGQARAICGVHHEGLGVGPCVLAPDHSQAEHEEAGGTRWTMPRSAAR